jgi:hypothetical protein
VPLVQLAKGSVAVIIPLFQVVFGQEAVVVELAELERCFHHQAQTLVAPVALVYILVLADPLQRMQVAVAVDHTAQDQLPQVVWVAAVLVKTVPLLVQQTLVVAVADLAIQAVLLMVAR